MAVSIPARASGGPAPAPTYIRLQGGTPAELQRRLAGRLGVVLPRESEGFLYIDWRVLHGLPVGEAAGREILENCCGGPRFVYDDEHKDPRVVWLGARNRVAGVKSDREAWFPTDRRFPDYVTVPWCNDDALLLAARTLDERVARYGAADPAVRAWLDTQDEVFASCSEQREGLTPLIADAPEWLKQDRAYQEAAFAFYNRRYFEAALRFGAIARDAASPWQRYGLYLKARSYYRQLNDEPDPTSIGNCEVALRELAAAPDGSFGKDDIDNLRRAVDFRERPAELLARLDRQLDQPALPPSAGLALRDYLLLKQEPEQLDRMADWVQALGQAGMPGVVLSALPDGSWLALRDFVLHDQASKQRAEAADWILTIERGGTPEAVVRARSRWEATKDVAWLIAAMAISDPGTPGTAELAEAAAQVAPGHPGWLTAQYHRLRLTLGTADAADARARIDAILARDDLTLGERNLFLGVRTQVAADLADLARHALRRPYCEATKPGSCVEDGWADDGFSDGDRTLGRTAQGDWVGLGEETRVIADRMPLATRIVFGRSPGLPQELRLDLALTSYARAVQLQDDAAIDGLAHDLRDLLPQLRDDWARIAATPPGPAKRFAEYFVMSKIPGLRADLSGYYRPQGTVPRFRGYWVDWMLVPPGQPAAAPDYPTYYDADSVGLYSMDPDRKAVDYTCRGKCGAGNFDAVLPPFVAADRKRADAERVRLISWETSYYQKRPKLPPGTTSLWEEMLGYAAAHPDDPRTPEAFYWLIRVARWGGNHDHLGKRAFQLIHSRHEASPWAKRAKTYWDG